MRRWRRRGRVCLTLVLTAVFVSVSLLPDLVPPAYAAVAPPLPVAEDPLGQEPEQQTPEISIDVDVRDGHLTVRVVDIWGPGRVPLVVRSYTNTQPSPDPVPVGSYYPPPPNNGPFRWQFNYLRDVVGGDFLEADGNRSSYRFLSERSDATNLWRTYVKDIGTYSTMDIHYTCEPQLPEGDPGPGGQLQTGVGLRVLSTTQAAPSDCTWDGWHVVSLPKGVVRKFKANLISEERDSNGNVMTYTHAAFPGSATEDVVAVTDPVGRQTQYAYEQAYTVCVAEGESGPFGTPRCIQSVTVYRVKTATDPYGRTATYAYAGTSLKVTSVTNAAGQITQYTYAGGLLASVTNARGFASTVEWTTGPDGTPRVSKVVGPDLKETTYAYTHESVSPYRVIKTTVTDARLNQTVYDVSDGNVVKITDPLGNAAQFAYDTRRNITQVTDAGTTSRRMRTIRTTRSRRSSRGAAR